MVFSGFFDEPKRPRPRFTAKEKQLHYKYQNGRCNGCGKKFDIRNLEVDHVKAFSKGGGERGHNLQLLCSSCNRQKGNGSQAQLKARLEKQGTIKKPAKAAPKAKAAKKQQPDGNKDPFADFFGF